MAVENRRWQDMIIGMSSMAGAMAVALALTSLVPVVEDLCLEDLDDADTRELQLNGHRVAYSDTGAGDPPVVLIHGFAGSRFTWRFLQQMLALRHRVISLDLWGFGGSARIARLVPALWTKQVLDVMQALAIPPSLLVGHSIGGRVAINCAATMPQRVRGLALVASDGAQLLSRYPFLWAMARTPLLRVMIYRLTHSREEVARLLKTTYADGQEITDDMVERYQRPLRVRGTFDTMLHLRGAYPGGDLTAMLRRVSCPATILWGEKDRVAPVHAAFEMLAALPATELLILPNIGHLPQEECPERVAEHLERFITRLG